MTTRQRYDFTFNWLVVQGSDPHQREILRKWVHTGELPESEDRAPTGDMTGMPVSPNRPKTVTIDMPTAGGGLQTIQTTQEDLDMVKQLRQEAIAQRAGADS